MSFIHIHERETSREFRVPHVAVKDGAKLVLTDEAQYRTAVEAPKASCAHSRRQVGVLRDSSRNFRLGL